MEFINTNLDKGNTKRIERYHKICQIALLVMWFIGMVAAFFLMARFFEAGAIGGGFLVFLVMFLFDFVFYFLGSLMLNITCGLYYDVRRIRMTQERIGAGNATQPSSVIEEIKQEPVKEQPAQRFFCPQCKATVIYGCESCENCGQRFSWNIQA